MPKAPRQPNGGIVRTTHEQTTAVTAEWGLTATVSDCDEPQATQGLQKTTSTS